MEPDLKKASKQIQAECGMKPNADSKDTFKDMDPNLKQINHVPSDEISLQERTNRGGAETMLSEARTYLANGEFVKAAVYAERILFIEPKTAEARKIRSDAEDGYRRLISKKDGYKEQYESEAKALQSVTQKLGDAIKEKLKLEDIVLRKNKDITTVNQIVDVKSVLIEGYETKSKEHETQIKGLKDKNSELEQRVKDLSNNLTDSKSNQNEYLTLKSQYRESQESLSKLEAEKVEMAKQLKSAEEAKRVLCDAGHKLQDAEDKLKNIKTETDSFKLTLEQKLEEKLKNPSPELVRATKTYKNDIEQLKQDNDKKIAVYNAELNAQGFVFDKNRKLMATKNSNWYRFVTLGQQECNTAEFGILKDDKIKVDHFEGIDYTVGFKVSYPELDKNELCYMFFKLNIEDEQTKNATERILLADRRFNNIIKSNLKQKVYLKKGDKVKLGYFALTR